MKETKSFVAGMLAGLAPIPTLERSNYPALSGTDMSRMRGDIERVGRQFSTVMDRENGKKAPTVPTPK